MLYIYICICYIYVYIYLYIYLSLYILSFHPSPDIDVGRAIFQKFCTSRGERLHNVSCELIEKVTNDILLTTCVILVYLG